VEGRPVVPRHARPPRGSTSTARTGAALFFGRNEECGLRCVYPGWKFDVDRRAAGSARELLGLLLGPTGNLRAPTFRKGRTLIVGFDEATYKRVLG